MLVTELPHPRDFDEFMEDTCNVEDSGLHIPGLISVYGLNLVPSPILDGKEHLFSQIPLTGPLHLSTISR